MIKIEKKLLISLSFLIALFASGVAYAENTSTGTSPDDMMEQADEAFSQMDLLKAEDLYKQAETGYQAEGDLKKAQRSEIARLNCTMILNEYAYNRTEAFGKLVPVLDDINITSVGMSNTSLNEYLSDPKTEKITIDDGEVRYARTLDNCFMRNVTFLRWLNTLTNTNPYDTDPGKFVLSRSDPNDLPKSETIRYEGLATLNISRDQLSGTEIIRVWIPTPIETDSQTNVSVNITPADWVVKKPDTHADLGMGYLGIPAEKLKGNLVINSSFTFTSHERRDVIDPDMVGEYNHSDPDYIKYTASGPMIRITPEVSALAREIVGDEKNPYLQARQIYRYVNTHILYSYVPHGSVEYLNISESVYALRNGYGDCGTQSDLFAALCRSLGIPARTTGGMHIFNDHAGYHAWAEAFIPGYGWIPADPSVGQMLDNYENVTPEQRNQYSEYFFGNQDPFRYYIQKDKDKPVLPDPGDIHYYHSFHQGPIVDGNRSISSNDYFPNWTVNITRAEKNDSSY